MEWRNHLKTMSGTVLGVGALSVSFLVSEASAEISWPVAPDGEIEGGKVGNYVQQIQDFLLPDEFSGGDGFQVDEDARLGIGVLNPDVNSRLDVNGKIKLRGGNPAVNKVLVSDADGLAEWKTVESVLTACAAGQVLKSDGTTWSCEEDVSGAAAGSITSATIADNSIESVDILDGSIAGADLAPNTAISQLSCTAGQIVQFDGTVWGCADYSAIGAGSVNSDAIEDGSITSVDIAAGSVAATHLDSALDLDPKVGALSVGKICEAQDVLGELKVVCSADAPSVAESDTLASVVARGNTVNNSIGIGDFAGGKPVQANIHVRDSVNPSLVLSSGTDDANDVSLFGVSTTNDAYGITGIVPNETILASNAGFGLKFATSSAVSSPRNVRMTITGSGKVGIGKDPSYALDVQGDIRATGVFRGDGSQLSGIVAASVADNSISSVNIQDGSIASVDIKLDDSSSCVDVSDAGNIRFVLDNGSGKQDFQGCLDTDGDGAYEWKSMTGVISQ